MILSCGHREDNFNRHYNIMTKKRSKENTRAVAYKCVCFFCVEEAKKNKEIIYSDEEAYNWLRRR